MDTAAIVAVVVAAAAIDANGLTDAARRVAHASPSPRLAHSAVRKRW